MKSRHKFVWVYKDTASIYRYYLYNTDSIYVYIICIYVYIYWYVYTIDIISYASFEKTGEMEKTKSLNKSLYPFAVPL